MSDQAKRWTACGDVVRRDGGDVAGCAGDSHAASRLAACADLLRGVGDLEGVAVMTWADVEKVRARLFLLSKYSECQIDATLADECLASLPVPPKGD